MLGKLRKIFGGQTAVEVSRDNPVLHEVVRKSAVIYSEIPLKDFITEQRRADLARQLFLDINAVCNAADPISALREKLAASMLDFAAYQVLVIRERPHADESGLRSQPGITGELHARFADLHARSGDLRAALLDIAGDVDPAQSLQQAYWQSYWFLETFNAARLELGDSIPGMDWYRAFMHAACARQEYLYRWELEMPPALPEHAARDIATAYAIYTDIVLSGARNPEREWKEYHRGQEVPRPAFD